MDKWLNNNKEKKDNSPPSNDKSHSQEELKKAKIKKIQSLIQKGSEPKAISKPDVNSVSDEFLKSIIEFKDWLNQRTYLKGDLAQIEMWIKNLYKKLTMKSSHPLKERIEADRRKTLKEEYLEIPPDFLEEKIRIALNKKLRGTNRTNSDNYYLRKLKGIIQDRLKEAKYYKILKEILDL